jgi:hypothetical protein
MRERRRDSFIDTSLVPGPPFWAIENGANVLVER